ncbi:YvcK family protein [Candidatus Falkowbacteria bacterium]|nr:YvcK family protein [Candidatus Falkowbacteria bacterium]
MKKIVTIGGGSGQFVLLSGLRDLKGINITAVVAMSDSGGSSGKLRDELGVLPPGDILKCSIALSPYRELARKILQTRFKAFNRLNGHVAGNLFLSILGQYGGSFPAGIKALGETLEIKGKVLPVSLTKSTLVAELSSGRRLYGETAIDIPREKKRGKEKIEKIYLVSQNSGSIKVYPPVLAAIKSADCIIIGPGDIYTSIMPNFLVKGVVEAIKKARGKVVYIMNIMTKFGETDGFGVEDFIKTIEDKIKRKLDYVLINSARPNSRLIKKYSKKNAEFVKIDKDLKKQNKKLIISDFLSVKGELARHDSEKTAKAIARIIKQHL